MTVFFYILIFLLGMCFGSFLNVLEWRIKNKISLFEKRSKCPECKQKIFWYDNIPIFSFLFLCGHCRHCKKKISLQYPIVEFLMGLFFVIVFYFFNDQKLVEIVKYLFIVWILFFVFIYDFKYLEVLDEIILPAILIIFVWNLTILNYSWKNMFLAIIIGGGFFFLQYILSRGSWVGGGDIRIGILMGVILSWPNILAGLFFAYILGAIINLGLIFLKKRKLKDQTAFGTYLSIATFLIIFCGDKIVNWYLNLLN